MKGCLPIFGAFFFGGIILTFVIGVLSAASGLLAALAIYAVISGIFAFICSAIEENGTKLREMEKSIKLATKKGLGKTRLRGWNRRSLRTKR